MAGNRGTIEAGAAFVRLFTKDADLVKGLKKAKEHLENFSQAATAIGAGMVAAGASLAAPIALSVKVFADFQDKMAAVGAVSGSSAAELVALTDQAKELGRTTSFTASQIAGLQLELGRAGFKPQEILDATTAIQNLGRATNTDLAKAAEIAGAALKQFALPATDATRVADVLTATANSSAQTVENLGEAFAYVGPVATDAGMSLEDTSKALGVLANLGLKGSMGGTGLRRAVLAFADPKIQAKMEGLGVKALDAQGNIRPLADVMLELGRATSNLPNAQRLALFQEMFDLRGLTAGMKLATSVEEMQKMSDAIDASGGAAERTAAKMDDTLGGTFRRIMSAVEGVQIAIGESMSDAIRGLDVDITTVLGNITRFVEGNRNLVLYAAATAAGLIVAGGGFLALGLAAKAAALSLGVVIGAMGAVNAVGGVVFGPAGLIIAGLALVTAAWMNWTESGKQALSDISAALETQKDIFGETFAGIQEAIAAGDYGGAIDILMAGMAASWHQGLADLLGMTGDFASKTLKAFTDVAWQIQTQFANIQTGIAKKLLEWASQEGIVGEQMRAFLGVDPREKTAKGKMTQQQRAGLSEQVSVWEEAKGRIGGSGTVESGVLQGTTVAQLDEWIKGALAKMQMDNAGLTGGQLAVAGAAEQERILDEENERKRKEIDDSLRGLTDGFDAWASAAGQRASDARARLSGSIAERSAAAEEDALQDWFDQRDAEDAAENAGPQFAGAEPGFGDTSAVPRGVGSNLTTYNAAAAQAAGFMGGGSPIEKMTTSIYQMAEDLKELGLLSKDQKVSNQQVVTMYERFLAAFTYA